VQRSEEEDADLSPHELLFFNFTTELAKWLEPYHNHARPSPSVILAEAVKQTEKSGKPTKSIEIPPENGNSNGNSKKDEEPPAVTPPPELVTSFFGEMQTRFTAAVTSNQLPPELLQIAALTQEALILFTIQTTRFKSASVVKINKLGVLVQSIKDVRAKAVDAVRNISAEMTKVGEALGTAECKDGFIQACHSLAGLPQIGPKAVASDAKKFVDERKKALDEFAKGMLKVAKNNA